MWRDVIIRLGEQEIYGGHSQYAYVSYLSHLLSYSATASDSGEIVVSIFYLETQRPN